MDGTGNYDWIVPKTRPEQRTKFDGLHLGIKRVPRTSKHTFLSTRLQSPVLYLYNKNNNK